MAAVRLNSAGSDEPVSAPVVFLDQTLIVFDIEQAKNATQVIHISRVPKAGLVSFRFQTNAPTRYIVSPNRGLLDDDKPVAIKIELVGNRYNAQHKLVVQAIAIQNKDDWKSIWDDPKTDEPGAFQTVWIELGTTLMSLEQTLNLTDPQNALTYGKNGTIQKASNSIIQLLNASNSKGAERVKELKDLIAMLRADNETLQRNIQQTTNLKAVIEKQLEERSSEAKDFLSKEEKLVEEEQGLYADLMRDENELKILREQRPQSDGCTLM